MPFSLPQGKCADDKGHRRNRESGNIHRSPPLVLRLPRSNSADDWNRWQPGVSERYLYISALGSRPWLTYQVARLFSFE